MPIGYSPARVQTFDDEPDEPPYRHDPKWYISLYYVIDKSELKHPDNWTEIADFPGTRQTMHFCPFCGASLKQA